MIKNSIIVILLIIIGFGGYYFFKNSPTDIEENQNENKVIINCYWEICWGRRYYCLSLR